MKVSHLLLISLLIVGTLLVPAVSAEIIEGQINDVVFEEFEQTPANESGESGSMNFADLKIRYMPSLGTELSKLSMIHLQEVQLLPKNSSDFVSFPNYQSYDMVLKYGSTVVCNVQVEFFKGYFVPSTIEPLNGITYGDVKLTFTNWNYDYLNTITTTTVFRFDGLPTENTELLRLYAPAPLPSTFPQGMFYSNSLGKQPSSRIGYHEYYYEPEYFINNYTISTDEYGTDIHITRIFDDCIYPSKIIISKSDGNELYKSPDYETGNSRYSLPYGDLIIDIEEEYGHIYRISEGIITPIDPTPSPTVMRTGTVTMTDNNGTSITGFEVTAVNHYTAQEYTVTTETDVAVMNLPMDRTIRMRNPQTGEYEDTVVGYYRFYGQAAGYKMLNEDGIQVAVMPEKYGSYQLCDIGVTSESGYLTGKHQFQIRSRSDNTVLQTGTVSAKSATTNDWYNTTVSDGLATLVLPYDTSNSISQYAGNYYVYATSPGYEDSDYGTQIVVMPHTVSEIQSILLTPIGGVPAAGNVTLRIQAFSETGPGVVNASIFIVGVIGEGASVWDTYTASSTGYLAVSVPGNSTYDIVASAEGYYDSARRVEVFTEDPGLIEMKLYLSGAPTVEPTTQPTGWLTEQPTPTQTGGIPDEDDDSEGFLMQAVRGIGLAFGVGFSTAKLIFGMLLALSIGYATAKQLRGGAAEFGLGLLGGTLLGVLIGLLPVWIIVVLLLVVGLYIGNRYVGGANNG